MEAYIATITATTTEIARTRTGITANGTIRLYATGGLRIYGDLSNEAGAFDPVLIHSHAGPGVWEGKIVGTRVLLEIDPQETSVKVRMVEI